MDYFPPPMTSSSDGVLAGLVELSEIVELPRLEPSVLALPESRNEYVFSECIDGWPVFPHWCSEDSFISHVDSLPESFVDGGGFEGLLWGY